MFSEEYIKGYKEALENVLVKLSHWQYDLNLLIDKNIRDWIDEKFEMLDKRKTR